MNRLVALGAVLALIAVCHTAAAPQINTVVVDHGIVGVGVVSGGTFGPGSFSIGRDGSSHRGQTHVYVHEDDGSENIFIQTTNHKVQQDNNRRPQHDNGEPNNSGGINSGNTQLFPVEPLTTLVNTGQAGIPGQGESEGGSIFIGGVVPPHHENNKVNKQPDALDAGTIEAVYASNTENNGFPSAGVAFNSGDSIAIGITGGNFGQATLSFNNKKPGANVPQQQSTANTGDIGHQNTGNEAPFSIGHGVSVYSPDASVLEAIFGSNSGNNEPCNTGNGGQGSVAIGAITGGHFGEGTWSLNNKKPEANVPQQQSAANNEDIGNQNTENNAPFSIGHGVSVYSPDASALEAIFGSNSGNNEHSSAGNGEQGSVAFGAITGGYSGEGTLSLNNKKPEANVPQQQSAANNGDIGHQNIENNAPFSKGHGVSVYSPDASALEAIFGSNSGNNEHSSAGNGGQGSVAFGAITGGHFGEGTLSLNNKKPEANVPQRQSAANNGGIGHQNAENEAPFSIGHGVSVYSPDPSALEAIFGSNSGNNEHSSAGNGGQGSVAFGAITGGHFGEGTLSLNNKKPEANVPQQQSAANNGGIGHQNIENNAPFSKGHGVSVYSPDASALEAIFGSNSGNNEHSSAGNGGQGSVAFGAITGGHFGEGTLSLNNKKPEANVPQRQSAANNGGIGHQNAENEAPFSIGHGVSVYSPDPSALEAIFGSNSGNNEHSSAGNGGQGSVAFGAITGGHFGEGTLSLNNKKPEANVPQQQSAANNGGIGHQNTENEAPFSIGHDVSVYSLDASALEAIFGSNSGNNEHSSAGNGEQGSVAFGAITGGHFGEGTLSLNNKKPEANVPQQQSAANNGGIGHQNTENEAPFSIGHGVSVYSPDPSALEAIFGSNSGKNEVSSAGNGGQGSVAIGAITGGHFGQGTLNFNNKSPGTNVPQLQSTVNNENTEYHNKGNEAPRSVEDGGNSNGNGNTGVGYNDGSSSTGYNAYSNEEPWIWNR